MEQYITAQDIIFGKSILPSKIIELMSPDDWEEFIKEWLETKEEAQNAPTPVTTYALFYNGEYVTNEQMNDKRFIKLLDGMEK